MPKRWSIQRPGATRRAIIFMLTASIVTLNFITDVMLSVIDPRVRKSILN